MPSTYSGAKPQSRVEVAQGDVVLDPGVDGRDRLGDLAGDEVLPSAGRLVVEGDAARGEQALGFAKFDRGEMSFPLGIAVGIARVECRGLVSWRRGGSEHL